jgi:AAA family ATP:ADP antiporter
MAEKHTNIFGRFMKRVFQVEPNELKAVFLSFAFVFTLMASYYILRPMRDAMASEWSDAELSTLFTVTFLLSFVAVALYGAACSRIKIGRLVPGIYGLFALSFFGFYLVIQVSPGPPVVGKAFYVWISIFSLFHVSVFWSFMADVFNKEQARRLFGFVASGSSIGALIGPLLALVLVGSVGKGNLLLISSVLVFVPMVIIAWLERLKHSDLHNEELNAEQDYQQTLGSNPLAGFMLFVKNPYLLGIGIFILLYTAISTFVYFELKNLMTNLDESTRTQLWAGMDFAVNILTIGTAMFCTSRLATRFGLAVTLALVPVVIVAGLLVVAMAPLIWVVVGLQIVRRAGNYGITRPGREMLFTVVDRESRFKAKSVIDIVVYRGGDMITAWAFTGLTQGIGLGLGAVAFVGTLIAGVWAFVGYFLGRTYDQGQGEKSNHREHRGNVDPAG